MNAKLQQHRQRRIRFRPIHSEVELHGICTELHEAHLLIQCATEQVPGQALEFHLDVGKRLSPPLAGYAEIIACRPFGANHFQLETQIRAIISAR